MIDKIKHSFGHVLKQYLWFAYDIIKSIMMQILINLSKNFDMAYKTIQIVFVPNMNFFGLMKTE